MFLNQLNARTAEIKTWYQSLSGSSSKESVIVNFEPHSADESPITWSAVLTTS